MVDVCDVSSLRSVRAYAAAFEGPLHVLVHNAGVMPAERTTSEDGNELMLATHVLGPHLLSALLGRALRAGAQSRVIWVSSGGMYGQRLRVDDLQYERGDYSPTAGYARTKRAQVVPAAEWAARLEAAETVLHSAHPGWADTFVRLAAAEAPGRCTGRFWHDRAPRPLHHLPRTKEDAAARRQLWDAGERLTGRS